jgi:hypothetical protein
LLPRQFQFFRPFRGNADTGIDAFGDEHLTSPHCYYDRSKQLWVCKELRHTACTDKYINMPASRHSSVDMYALLSGASSLRYQVAFTLRRKSRTTITRTGYSGATATWLPGRHSG